jgi:predicted  nucleic acid-binding Zn-ribbon protein
VSGGQVTDQDKFSRMMRTNAKALQHLNLGGNDDLKKAALGALGSAGVGSLIASIKRNPVGNAGLRSKLEELSNYAHQPDTDVSDQTLNDLENFHTQMDSLDKNAAKREGKAAMAELQASDKAAAAAPGLAMNELEAARKEVKDAEAAVAKITQQIERNRTKAEAALEAGKGNKYIAKTAQEQKMLQEQAAAQEKLQAAQNREQAASAAQRPYEVQQIQNQIAALRAERESFANIAEKTIEEAEKLAEIEANLDAKYARLADLGE